MYREDSNNIRFIKGREFDSIAGKLILKKFTVYLTLRRHEQPRSLEDRERSGLSRVTSGVDDQQITLINK